MFGILGKTINELSSQSYHMNLALFYKIVKRLTVWERHQFNFYLLINDQNVNNVVLVVRSRLLYIFPTITFESTNSNMEASINECINQFKEMFKEQMLHNELFDNKNIKLNQWWDRFILSVPKENSFINIEKISINNY